MGGEGIHNPADVVEIEEKFNKILYKKSPLAFRQEAIRYESLALRLRSSSNARRCRNLRRCYPMGV